MFIYFPSLDYKLQERAFFVCTILPTRPGTYLGLNKYLLKDWTSDGINILMTRQGPLSSDTRPVIDQIIRTKGDVSFEDHPHGLHTVETGWNFVDLEHSAPDTQRLGGVTKGTFAVIRLRVVPPASPTGIVTG